MRRLNPDQRVECHLFLLVLRDGALQLGRDLLVVEEGLRQLRKRPDLSFMRLILQDTNAVLLRVGFTREEVPGAAMPTGEGSHYAGAVRRADDLLGLSWPS
ncbi:hypothetical protein [Sinorhizobium meliloti]|uniref:hypothetical protein n=1 Tax=Rhizobium meliloti TaxID=382 RepID=UPI001F17A483|nr:hypothetical protein [Sinorhizobium meliloti]